MTTRSEAARRMALGAITLALIVPAAMNAQTPVGDPRWEAWLGCWQSVSESAAPGQATARVCVSPLRAGSAVEVATLSGTTVVARDTIDASGAQRAVGTPGCTGWRRATWSRDARRVYLQSEISCGGTLVRASTGVLAMSPRGEWLDIQSATANGNAGVRAVRYVELGAWFADLPAEFKSAIEARTQLPYAARSLAGSPIAAGDIVEAVAQLDSVVVQTWLVERGQRFELDARALVALAKAGVPGSVTDVMIGISFPDHFALAQAAPTTDAAPLGGAGISPRFTPLSALQRDCYGAMNPLLWDPMFDYDPCGYRYGYRGGRMPWDYGYGGYGYGYGYGGYGYSGPVYNGGYRPPVVVVVKDELPHGKVIKGQGYTRGRGTQSRGDMSADPLSEIRSTRSGSSGGSSAGSSSGRSTSGSSSGKASGSSSSGSSSSGRTAQVRKPPPPK